MKEKDKVEAFFKQEIAARRVPTPSSLAVYMGWGRGSVYSKYSSPSPYYGAHGWSFGGTYTRMRRRMLIDAGAVMRNKRWHFPTEILKIGPIGMNFKVSDRQPKSYAEDVDDNMTPDVFGKGYTANPRLWRRRRMLSARLYNRLFPNDLDDRQRERAERLEKGLVELLKSEGVSVETRYD